MDVFDASLEGCQRLQFYLAHLSLCLPDLQINTCLLDFRNKISDDIAKRVVIISQLLSPEFFANKILFERKSENMWLHGSISQIYDIETALAFTVQQRVKIENKHIKINYVLVHTKEWINSWYHQPLQLECWRVAEFTTKFPQILKFNPSAPKQVKNRSLLERQRNKQTPKKISPSNKEANKGEYKADSYQYSGSSSDGKLPRNLTKLLADDLFTLTQTLGELEGKAVAEAEAEATVGRSGKKTKKKAMASLLPPNLANLVNHDLHMLSNTFGDNDGEGGGGGSGGRGGRRRGSSIEYPPTLADLLSHDIAMVSQTLGEDSSSNGGGSDLSHYGDEDSDIVHGDDDDSGDSGGDEEGVQSTPQQRRLLRDHDQNQRSPSSLLPPSLASLMADDLNALTQTFGDAASVPAARGGGGGGGVQVEGEEEMEEVV